MAFDPQPTLHGDGIVLRPLREADREPLRQAAADPLIWEQHPDDRHRPERFAVYFDGALAAGSALVIAEPGGRLIGSSRYGPDRVRPGSGAVEIGWTFLTRDHWGGRTNAEVKRLMIGHAFTAHDEVVFLVGTENLRSRRAVEKLGARLDDEHVDLDGLPHVAYRLTRDAWTG
jgi:N-acetyltransferase